MSWSPNYTITDRFLLTIREAGEVIGEIRSFGLTGKALAKLEWSARELSAYASTSIEGNPLALTEVKRALKTTSTRLRDTEREVVNYNRALETLYASVRRKKFRLSVAALEKTQGQVVDGLMENPADVGRLRRAPVVIRNPHKRDEIVFLPPDANDVRPLLADLVDFVNARLGRMDPVTLAGIFHRQCVIIHPFMDGNGRATRLLTTAILGASGLDLFEIFSFENYYNRNVAAYFRAVGLTGDYYDLKENVDFTAWLEYFADGILDELRRVRKALPESALAPPRLEAHHRRLLDYVEKHGSVTQREYGAFSARSLAARKLDFRKLLEAGLLEARGSGRGIHYMRSAK